MTRMQRWSTCLVSFCLLCLTCATGFSEVRYVGRGGLDSSDGSTYQTRWRTLTHAFFHLQPGDTLRITPGKYNIANQGYPDGIFFLRNADFTPLHGSPAAYTTITADQPGTVVIRGNLDLRGSYIRIEGLEFRGSLHNESPGIGIYDSHHIDIIDNNVLNCGGGGIQINHSDSVRVIGNYVAKNAYRNPGQQSGISVYQAIAMPDPENRDWGIEIKNNYCWRNWNKVPGANGITDGNGIIVDDFKYEQTWSLSQEHLDQIGDLENYPRATLIEGNICNYNGGCGINCHRSSDIAVKNNTCVGNRRHIERLNGEFVNAGQVSLASCSDCHVLNNILQSTYVAAAVDFGYAPFAASEFNGVNNFWENNLLHTTVPGSYLRNYDSPHIEFNAFLTSPRFVDRRNLDWRSRAGRGLGITWGNGHVYTDFAGVQVTGSDVTDLGALQY